MRKTYVDKHIFLSYLVQNKLSLTIGKFPDGHAHTYIYIISKDTIYSRNRRLFRRNKIHKKRGDRFGVVEI